MKYLSQFQSYFTHPLNQGRPFLTMQKYLSWQFRKRVLREPRIFDLDQQVKIKCYPDSPLGALIAYCTLPEYDELMFLKNYLKPGNTFVDVGANIGLFSLLASACVGEHGKVYAFEPFPAVRERLTENVNLNNLKNVNIESTCISERIGMTNFVLKGESTSRIGMPDEEGIKVPMTTLDNYIEKHQISSIDLLKIDVEGAEFQVLKGAQKMLSGKICKVIMMETNELSGVYGYERTEIFEYLNKHNYRLFTFDAVKNEFKNLENYKDLPQNIFATCSRDRLF